MEANTKPKPILLTFEYRNTGMGGFDDTRLISFSTGRVISSHLNTTRSGSHGERTFSVFFAKYLMYQAKRSNLGNTYIKVSVIKVDQNGYKELKSWSLYEGRAPKNPKLPENIRQLLLANKDDLPLFEYVENVLSLSLIHI